MKKKKSQYCHTIRLLPPPLHVILVGLLLHYTLHIFLNDGIQSWARFESSDQIEMIDAKKPPQPRQRKRRRRPIKNRIRRQQNNIEAEQPAATSYRQLSNNYYYETTDLGVRNYSATMNNPMKGLSRNPINDSLGFTGVHYTTEMFYFGLDQVLQAPNVYDWTTFEAQLDSAKSRNTHSIPRFYVQYPQCHNF
jgi:hypothetical protein